MNRIFNYLINHQSENQTIEQYLLAQGYSKNLIIHLRKTTLGITIGGDLVYTTHRLKAGEKLTIQLIESESSTGIIPIEMKLDIIYEDDDLIVINKPANLPVHPSQGHYYHTLANGVAYYFQQKDEQFVFRAINRLDRDTTGLIILAKHLLSATLLYQMIRNREVKREYAALVQGLTADQGTITAPIARLEGSTIERCVDFTLGEYACTHYQLISYHSASDYSFVRLWLETGRTHQIRVHMKHLGHPLPGDFLYYPDYRYINRQALHSYRLTLTHPLQHQLLTFEAPIPEDMQCCIVDR